jgi:hypothetical protein
VTASLHLTPRDREILQALVQKVRLFSQRQIADHWWNGELPNTRRRLKRLAERGLVERITVLARAIPVLKSPLVSWRPGDASPDFGSIAYHCQERWRRRPARPSVVWLATKGTSQSFGGTPGGQLKHPTQATHDLGVAAVWLRSPQRSAQRTLLGCADHLGKQCSTIRSATML